MSRKSRSRFDVEIVEDLAGDRVLARGAAYHRDGQVEILVIDATRVLARVAGTEDYRVELTGHGKSLAGMCTCPAFDHQDVCKHMVAAALAANEAGDDAAGDDALARIHRTHPAKAALRAIAGRD